MASAKSLFFAVTLAIATCQAQSPSQATQPAPSNESPITQFRKSVTFIKLRCGDGGQEFDVRGTGFFVIYPEPRLGNDRGFGYLVTNRHVALCWNESGRPIQVERISITLNRKQAEGDSFVQDESLNGHGNVPWVVPEDDSVDLAVLPFIPDQTRFDFKAIPTKLFASSEFLKRHGVTEGEPVFFAGFFYQFPGTMRMEPIVRQGIIAMMQDEKVPFVGMAERVYFADLHAFGGNSGSPAFFNLGGYRNGSLVAGDDYHLLGVVNAEVTEDQNFNLELTTTMKGKGAANSGVSTIVPADEVLALLDDPRLRRIRDDAVKAAGGAQK